MGYLIFSNFEYLCSKRLTNIFKTDLKRLWHISASCQRLKGTVQELLKKNMRDAIIVTIHSVKALIQDPEMV